MLLHNERHRMAKYVYRTIYLCNSVRVEYFLSLMMPLVVQAAPKYTTKSILTTNGKYVLHSNRHQIKTVHFVPGDRMFCFVLLS